MKSKITKEKIIVLFLILISYFYFFNLIVKRIDVIVNLKLFVGIVISVCIYLVCLYISENKNIVTKFTIIASIFGVLFIFFNPLLHGIDEGAHFYKIYSYFSDVKGLPINIYRLFIETYQFGTFGFIGKDLTVNELMNPEVFKGANFYTWISYLPYILPAYLTISILKLNLFDIIIIIRIFGFCTYLLASIYAIKIIPDKKMFMAIFCLMPSILTSVTCISGDLCTNIPIILFISIWYRLYKEDRKISLKEGIAFSLLGMIMGCSKIIYALFVLLIFALPNEKFNNKKHKYFVLISILVSVLIIAFGNLIIVGNAMVDSYPRMGIQKDIILLNPVRFIFIFLNSILINWKHIYQFTTNYTILHNIYYPSDFISFAYFSVLILSLFVENSKVSINKALKIIIPIIVFLIVFVIYISMYIQWTTESIGLGCNYIDGVQSRYFIPIAILAVLLGTEKIKLNENYLWFAAILINYLVLMSIIVKVF